MKSPTRLGWGAYAAAALVVVLDQAVKLWLVGPFLLPLKGSVRVAGPLSLSFVQNRGVSFGLMQAEAGLVRWALVVFSLGVAAALIAWARRPERASVAAGLGLIIGGAVGNAIDRARLGYVIDFIDVQRLGFFPWVFNVADSAITVGVALLLLDSLRRERAA
jgi:signal peptidase II